MPGVQDLTLKTAAGNMKCRLHRADPVSSSIIWVFGAGGGLGGPAGGMYERLAAQLMPEGVTSLQMDYRKPGVLNACIEDTLSGIIFLRSLGSERIALVGHSFGGAVVIGAGVISPEVVGVAALSSQSYGTDMAPRLSPRPLLLMHGEEDEILPADASREIYRRAKEPKTILLYPGCRHGLDQCRDAIDRDLSAWLHEVLPVASPVIPDNIDA